MLFYRLVCELTDPSPAVRYVELRQRAADLAASEKAHNHAVRAHDKLIISERNRRAYLRRKAGLTADDVITDLNDDSISIADAEPF